MSIQLSSAESVIGGDAGFPGGSTEKTKDKANRNDEFFEKHGFCSSKYRIE